ncbi:MAG TPA: hypothetical protein VFA68_09245 [Terriglobales bacterium]|nr:hypothetical protein [Terriglobales bacterium]
MTCAELQQGLPEIVDKDWSAEQEKHLQSCPACAGVVSDLKLIVKESRALQGSEEPSIRVWDFIQTELQQEQEDLQLIAQQASLLRESDEPSPRVWTSIASVLHEYEADGEVIAREARELQGSEEPSPRVWNSLEIALREEGLIRKAAGKGSLVRQFPRWRWQTAWLLPVAAGLIVGIGFRLHRDSAEPKHIAVSKPVVVLPDDFVPKADLENPDLDRQMLDDVAARAPSLRQRYENDLHSVNSYIRDAQQSLRANPNDEEAQQSLINAVEQRSMLYQLAGDHSLP